MATSPAHQFGQYLGNILEAMLLPELEKFAKEFGVYIDKHGIRPGVRSGKKTTWADKFGNSHDLDFVIERGGTDTKIGRPLAFIEAAWRRYTKHSRNKAQEIQGAILPMAETYPWDRPFLGAFLAGHFTSGSLTQLKSLGFSVVYVPYEDYVAAFAAHNIDIRFDEDTEDAAFSECLTKISEGGEALRKGVLAKLRGANRKEIDEFLTKLERKLMRHIVRVTVLTLYGKLHDFDGVEGALGFVNSHVPVAGEGTFQGFEVSVRYSNEDCVQGTFEHAAEVTKFSIMLQLNALPQGAYGL